MYLEVVFGFFAGGANWSSSSFWCGRFETFICPEPAAPGKSDQTEPSFDETKPQMFAQV